MGSKLEDTESRVLTFMEQVQEEQLIADQEQRFLNSPEVKIRMLNKCHDDAKTYCLDSILCKLYKDAIPLSRDYKVANDDKLTNDYDAFIKQRCPNGIEWYIKEGMKRNSPFAKRVLEAVNELVKNEYHDIGMNIDNVNRDDLVFASNDDLQKKIDVVGQELEVPEISQVINDNVKNTAISEITRAKKEKEKLQDLEKQLANDINVDSNQALESALMYNNVNTPKNYTPSLFNGIMINKLEKMKQMSESTDLDNIYLYGALDCIKESFSDNASESSEDSESSIEELAFIESVKEYTGWSMLKALKLESFDMYKINDLANKYAMNKI